MKSFNELSLSPEMNQAIVELGYETPSAIQSQALPILLADPTDFIGLAATGTGKTAAFGIPLIEKIDPSQAHVQAVILCPTRELALQVTGQINLLGKFKKITALPIYGGAGYSDQIHGLKSGHQVVVGTPGRLVDHIERGTLQIENVTTIVLDEADKMVSMGFKEELETILGAAGDDTCNTWLFSATMEPEVRKVADAYLTQPKIVQVNRTEVLSDRIEQIYYPTRESDKPEILCKLIEASDQFYGVIFCQTKSLVTDLSHYLASRGYKVDSLHGDKSQHERERTMQAFRDKKVDMLVCTDVASRGLDVKDITHVVNYSIPRELEVYVHRIGRTARSGKSGIAISLVTTSHRGLIPQIEKITRSKMKEGRVPSRRDVGLKKVAKLLTPFQEQKNFTRAVELLSPEWQAAIAGMTPAEIVGRFLCFLNPETFENQEKSKPLQSPVMMDSRGNALPNENRREGGTGRGRHRNNHSRREYRGASGRSDRGGMNRSSDEFGRANRNDEFSGRGDDRGEKRNDYRGRSEGRDHSSDRGEGRNSKSGESYGAGSRRRDFGRGEGRSENRSEYRGRGENRGEGRGEGRDRSSGRREGFSAGRNESSGRGAWVKSSFIGKDKHKDSSGAGSRRPYRKDENKMSFRESYKARKSQDQKPQDNSNL